MSSETVAVKQGQTWQHVKRGTTYEVIGIAELQAGQLQAEHAELVIYRGEDGKLWARNSGEFTDGRFTRQQAEATRGGEVFGYWVEQRLAEPAFLRKPAYIPEPDENRTVTPLYAATRLAVPTGVGREVVAEALWKRACVGREGYCSTDLQDAAKWAIGEALRLAEQVARSAELPDHFQWSEGNREKFYFGRDSAADAIALLSHAEAGGVEGWKLVPVELTPEMVTAWEGAEPEGGWAGMPRLGDEEANQRLAQAEWSAMLAAVPASPTEAPGSEGAGWRTMDSAPEDALIDLWSIYNNGGTETGERLVSCRWRNESVTYDEGWHDCFGNKIEWTGDDGCSRRVTHWMPLPAAPTRLALNEQEGE